MSSRKRKSPRAAVVYKRHRALKETLDRILAQQDCLLDRERDPVGVVHQMAPEDQEAGALLAATLAYGRTTTIRSTIRRVLEAVTGNPAGRGLAEGLVEMADHAGQLQRMVQGIQHRWTGPREISLLLAGMGRLLREWGTVEAAFLGGLRANRLTQEGPDTLCDSGGVNQRLTPRQVAQGIANLSLLLRPQQGPESTGETSREEAAQVRTMRWLLPSPLDGSAAKRMCLFLRWMCRPANGIDLGRWTAVPPAALVIPLDVHIHRIGRRLGMTKRSSADWKTAMEITGLLSRFLPEDPLRYDFALCHLGIRGDCPSSPAPGDCSLCPAFRFCLAPRGRSGRLPSQQG